MIYQTKAEIVFNQRIRGKYFHCFLRAPKIAQAAQPGQFVQIKVSNGCAPLLRRPFSIYKVTSHKSQVTSKIEVLYEIAGEGTRALSQRKAGEFLDIIGPLGNGFDYRSPLTAHHSLVLVAGGMGVAPLVFLADKLRALTTSGQRPATILIGAKNKNQILCEREFKKLGCEVKIATDDGSRGFHGKVTDLLKHLPSTIDHRPSTIYACGPAPMLKAVAVLAKQYRIPAQVSLEAHMACGIGACLGCVVETIEGYKRVCQEGPVFPAQEVVW